MEPRAAQARREAHAFRLGFAAAKGCGPSCSFSGALGALPADARPPESAQLAWPNSEFETRRASSLCM